MISVGFYFLSPCSRDGRNDKYDESFTAINFYLLKFIGEKILSKKLLLCWGNFLLVQNCWFFYDKDKREKESGKNV